MTRGKGIALACAGVLCLSTAFILGQDTIRVRTDLVDVDVSVRDAESGALVGGLRQDDFTVLEDGKPQMISNFSSEVQPLSAAILIDTAMNGDQLRRFSLVAPTLLHEFKAADEFEVYRFDHVVTKLSDFTSNPQNLEKGLDAVKDIGDSRPPDSDPNVVVGPSPLRWILDRAQVGTNGAPPDPTRPPATAPTKAGPKSPDSVSRVLHDMLFTAVADLEKRPKKMRKIMLLVSNGVVSGTNEHTQSEVVSRLFRNGIQIYAVDPEHKVFDHMTLLNSYTKSTGGEVFDGTSEQSMARGFAQVLEQARDQYRLGYYSTNELTGNRPVLRKIDVKVKEGPAFARKKLKIIHRQNYMQYPQ